LTSYCGQCGFDAWKYGNKIAFVSYRDGNAEIYTMDKDGGNPSNLTHHQAGDFCPSWSPDGEKIAFLRNSIFLMNPDGSGVEGLEIPSPYSFEWYFDPPCWLSRK